MTHLRSRWTALFLALVLSLSLALPASAAQEDRAQAAHEAAQYAMQYGGAVSVQYALWENGEVTLQGHDGVYSKTENRALTDDDLYGIGSISKTYTAAAMMKLVEQGKVDLDEPVTAYLPDFTMADPRYTQITVRMLLNHSSGLMGTTNVDAFLLDSYFGISPLIARELAFRSAGETDAHLFDLGAVGEDRLWKELSGLIRDIQENHFTPICLKKDGKMADFTYCPIAQYGPVMETVRYDTFSTLMDDFYALREQQEKRPDNTIVLRPDMGL